MGEYSHAEGGSGAIGEYSHAEGVDSAAYGYASHAEGGESVADGQCAHAEGSSGAHGAMSHSEGNGTANGYAAHAEGYSTANGEYSHAEGIRTIADGRVQHVQGKYNIADTTSAFIIGNGTSTSNRSNAHTLDWNGNAWFSGDVYVGSTSGTNKDEGSKKLATEEFVTEAAVNADWNQNDIDAKDYIKNRPFYTNGLTTTLVDNILIEAVISGDTATIENPFSLELIEGNNYIVTWNGVDYNVVCYVLAGALALGNASILHLGEDTEEPFLIGGFDVIYLYTTDDGAITISIKGLSEYIKKIDSKFLPTLIGRMGSLNTSEVFNDYANNIASGMYSHAEGDSTEASGSSAHAEGYETEASGKYSHVEGSWSKATNNSAHAEGYETEASGKYSHSEGRWSEATNEAAHAEGMYTIARGKYSHAQGKYNIEDTSETYAHIVGNGTSKTSRSNAHTIDWDGNAWFAGDVYVGSTSGTNKDEGSKKLATEEFVTTEISIKADKTYVDTQDTAILTDAKSYTDTKVASLVDSAPETLNTLNELAAALGDDPNFATTTANQIGTKANASDLTSHTGNTTVHITADERTKWNGKADKADIATTAMQGTATGSNTYWKIHSFGNWGTGNWAQKGFSMIITSRAGEMIWLSLAANDSNTSAGAIRLINRYSKIAALHYSASENAIYVTAAAWANNICAHIISNVNGDYVPAVSSASALPSDAVAINIVEFGINNTSAVVGDNSVLLEMAGSADRPTYNGANVALQSDIPSVPVQSVNGKTGAVQLTASDVGAAPAYTYGTDDLVAGSSPLATGKLYFVYE